MTSKKNTTANIITIKLPYTLADSSQYELLHNILRQYNSVFRCTYNLDDSIYSTTKSITAYQNNCINNISLIGSHLKNSARIDVASLKAVLHAKHKDTSKVIFGGKRLFKLRCEHKISKAEFALKRLRPLYSVGEANSGCNRLFTILDSTTIQYKHDRHNHFILKLLRSHKQFLKYVPFLIAAQSNKLAPITYKLDMEYVYISFDINACCTDLVQSYNVVPNRVLSLDLNPNYIGYTVVQYNSACTSYNIIKAGVYDLMPLYAAQTKSSTSSDSSTSKYYVHKRTHELRHIAIEIAKLCKHYHTELCAIEHLDIVISDKGIGRHFNRTINNIWNRNVFIAQLRKMLKLSNSSTKLLEVPAAYSSVIGNIVFRQTRLPDMCLAALEIGRRGFMYYVNYKKKQTFDNDDNQSCSILFPHVGSMPATALHDIAISLEEIGVGRDDVGMLLKEATKLGSKSDVVAWWKQLYYDVVVKPKKNIGFLYWLQMKLLVIFFFSCLYKRRYYKVYSYI